MTYRLDEEIVGSVHRCLKAESDGEEETVSIKNVLEGLDNVFNFLVHPPAGFNVLIATVRSLRKQVLMHHVNKRNSQC